MPFGLPEHAVESIRAVFRAHPDIEEVILYGSRAKGNCDHGSDIDLACRGNGLTQSKLNGIRHELDELLLPYSIDLSSLESISNTELLDHIARVGIVFYQRRDQRGEGGRRKEES